MSGPEVDRVQLLLDTMAHIEEHPEEHNQEEWWCGTSGCLAGHLANLHPDVYLNTGGMVRLPDGALMHVSDWAEWFLGLGVRSILLFVSDNTREDLRELVDAYARAAKGGDDPVEALDKTYGAITVRKSRVDIRQFIAGASNIIPAETGEVSE